jgi:tRNA dimethylallyltransferase
VTNQPPDAEPLWVVTGPTASGKTALALQLAERLGLEILSMDSMAVYRGMDVGTAKPDADERARVPHWLVDLVEPSATFDTARWCEAAAAALAAVLARGRRAVFVGGTPLYLMAFFKGMMSGPAADPAVRARLEATEAAEPGRLHAELQQLDPDAAARIHRHDLRRLVRAHEVLQLTGRSISSQQQHFDRPTWARPCRIVAVHRERDDLHVRVKQRTEWMLDHGGRRDRLRRVPRLPARPLQGPRRVAQPHPTQHPPADPPPDHVAASAAGHRLARRRRGCRRRADGTDCVSGGAVIRSEATVASASLDSPCGFAKIRAWKPPSTARPS